jgi:sigma-54 dependent transcriptional regulator, flagellar regulatory protein
MSVGKFVTTGAMAEALEILRRVASSSCTVLVTGESGTGKEVAVRSLHDMSPRANRPFVAINCGAIAQNIVETELFGHARGAFTGAATARRGLVAAAEGGTLFLDEVGELSPATQVKLLRLLQAREYTPVGETKPVSCDVRVVAATNRNLQAEVAAGRFREDLYFRLDVIHVHLPPLRARRQEIRPLAEHFLRLSAERSGRPDVTGFAPGVLDLFESDEWPGNIRALENTIERAVLLARGVEVDHDCLPARMLARAAAAAPTLPLTPPSLTHPRISLLPVAARLSVRPSSGDRFTLPPPTGDGMVDLRAAVDALESRLIKRALEKSSNNKQRAADLLGIKRTTLIDMMKRKGLAA